MAIRMQQKETETMNESEARKKKTVANVRAAILADKGINMADMVRRRMVYQTMWFMAALVIAAWIAYVAAATR